MYSIPFRRTTWDLEILRCKYSSISDMLSCLYKPLLLTATCKLMWFSFTPHTGTGGCVHPRQSPQPGTALCTRPLRNTATAWWVIADAPTRILNSFYWGIIMLLLTFCVVNLRIRACSWTIIFACTLCLCMQHNLFCDNCHSHVARSLNLMRYGGSSSWNMYKLGFLMVFKGKFTG